MKGILLREAFDFSAMTERARSRRSLRSTIRKCAFATALVVMAAIFVLSGTAFAGDPDTEAIADDVLFADDVLEDPASHDSDPGVMHDIDEVGQPEVRELVILFGQWEREGYPDDIGGVYYDNQADSYGVLVVDPSPQRVAELRELLGDDVIITPCRFSYNELLMVNDEIVEMMGSNQNSGISAVGLGWTSTGGRVHGFGESGKEFRVIVYVDESVFDHYSAGFMSRYGERVIVEAGVIAIVEDSVDGMDMEGRDTALAAGTGIVPIEITGVFSGGIGPGGNTFPGNSYWLWLVIGVALLGTLLLFVWKRPRQAPAMQTADGGIVTGNAALTRKQVVDAVKNSETAPGDGLFEAIMQRIDSDRQ